MQTKAGAEKEGKALLKRMKGKGWKLKVWENIGWWYRVHNGPVAVYPTTKDRFFCLLNDNVKVACGGLATWTDDFRSKDPNRAVSHQVKFAREVLDRMEKAVCYVEGVIGTKR